MVQPLRFAFAVDLGGSDGVIYVGIDDSGSSGSATSSAAIWPRHRRRSRRRPQLLFPCNCSRRSSSVHHGVDSIHAEKWKRGNIRDEATQNISQIQRDIDVTLPPMLRDADTAPASLSKLLPISRNISALYDVLLRVVEASRVIAPDDQVATLQQALVTLGNARLAFGERMQTSAAAMEKQVSDLRTDGADTSGKNRRHAHAGCCSLHAARAAQHHQKDRPQTELAATKAIVDPQAGRRQRAHSKSRARSRHIKTHVFALAVMVRSRVPNSGPRDTLSWCLVSFSKTRATRQLLIAKKVLQYRQGILNRVLG